MGGTDKQTDKRKSPCVLQDFIPFGAAAQKADWRTGSANLRPERADYRPEKANWKSRRANLRPVRAGFK